MEHLSFSLNSNKTDSTKWVASFLIMLALWWAIPKWFADFPNIVFVDSSIWHLIALGMLLWLLSFYFSNYLFRQTLIGLGLPKIQLLISQFHSLTLWQKFIVYALLFMSCWLGLLLSMIAVL